MSFLKCQWHVSLELSKILTLPPNIKKLIEGIRLQEVAPEFDAFYSAFIIPTFFFFFFQGTHKRYTRLWKVEIDETSR